MSTERAGETSEREWESRVREGERERKRERKKNALIKRWCLSLPPCDFSDSLSLSRNSLSFSLTLPVSPPFYAQRRSAKRHHDTTSVPHISGRHRHRGIHRQTHRHIGIHRHTDTEGQTDTQTQRDKQTDTNTVLFCFVLCLVWTESLCGPQSFIQFSILPFLIYKDILLY